MFTRAGWYVHLYDVPATALDAARQEIPKQLKLLVAYDLWSETDTIM